MNDTPQPSARDLQSTLVSLVAEVLDVAPEVVSQNHPLEWYGLDSVHLAQLRQVIETRLRVSIPFEELAAQRTFDDLVECANRKFTDSVRPRRSPMEAFPGYVEFKSRWKLLDDVGVDNPYFRVCDGVAEPLVGVEGVSMINYASYNYLGLCGDPAVSGAACRAIERFGTSVSASRVASGERHLHRQLELALAELHGAEDSIVFVSGNLTNVSTIGHLMGSGDVVLHDQLAHDSILQGCRLSGAKRISFRHNDWQHLDHLLSECRQKHRNALVVIEGLYSMDGDIPELPRFIEVKRRHAAFLMIDEAHSIGVLGTTGRGLAEHFNVAGGDVDLWMGTLSKTLASCGGWIAGSRELIEYLKYTAPGFVFSVGMPAPNAAAALAAVHRMRAVGAERVARLRSNSRTFLARCRELGLDTGSCAGFSVVPVITGSSALALGVSHDLRERGINVQPMLYPAVEEGAARLRFFICSEHTHEQLELAAEATMAALARRRSVGPIAPRNGVGRTAEAWFQVDTRMETLTERIRQMVSSYIKVPLDTVSADQPLEELGVDSIFAMEIRDALEQQLRVGLSLSELLRGGTPRGIARLALDSVGANARRRVPPPIVSNDAHPYERHVNPVLGALLRNVGADRPFVRGEGAWLFDDSGRRVLDLVANYGAVPFGPDDPALWRAIEEFGRRSEPSLIQPSVLEAAGRLAEQLVNVAPAGLRTVTFANSGAEAIEAAIKLARAATGRRGILSTVGSFHGKTMGALSASGRADYQAPFHVPVAGFHKVAFDDLSAMEEMLANLGHEIAAVIVEPIQGEGGVRVPRPGWLSGVRQLCTHHGVLMIADEVQTGLGRTGTLFACDHEGVTPDILCLAKALGGGLVPMAAVLHGDAAWSESFAELHSSTFAGNSLGCRVGLAILDRLLANDRAAIAHVRDVGTYLHRRLEALRSEAPTVITEVRGRGLMLAVELAQRHSPGLLDLLAREGRLGLLISSYLLTQLGIRTAPTMYSTNVLRITPSLALTREQADIAVDGLTEVVRLVRDGRTDRLIAHLLPDGGNRAIEPPPTVTLRSSAPAREPTPAHAPRHHWAFIAHPLEFASYRSADPSLARLSDRDLRALADKLPELVGPVHAATLHVESAIGTHSRGELFIVPYTSEQILRLDPRRLHADLSDAIVRARELGAKLVGLGGHVSIALRGGRWLSEGVALTTGNGLTAVCGARDVLEGLQRLGISHETAKVAVVGATGSTGQAVAALLGERCGQLVMIGRQSATESRIGRLEQILARLVRWWAGRPAAGPIGSITTVEQLLAQQRVVLTCDTQRMFDCDAIVLATSSLDVLVRPEAPRPGTLIVDLSRPFNTDPSIATKREDVVVLPGGIMEIPGRPDLSAHFELAPGTGYACLCETMLLGLEGVETTNNFTTSLDRLDWLAELAERHGFSPAAAPFGGAQRWDRARRAREEQ